MYLILYPSRPFGESEIQPAQFFQSAFTTDMHNVVEALKNKEAEVYSLQGMTRIRDMKVTYEEVTQEMIDG